ncbi:LysM peptidoglycan-binding domain-containing protein [Antarcticirhabdus aurantiaca]|uniref:LysM domain-containing protein n=1 Tax=Antarcticirhabdus aurantiaca TaxID=2606717 RepID=A0ACD4NRV1_9HYPH|nr:LysM domain-containing protein [Antarcticirhabdus aurantiaca]WAJ29551.1 LysM domain-containing protein [Jeongeuplla avenae]
MPKPVILAVAMLMSGVSMAYAQGVASPCGDSVEVRRGDTLSAIAERCNVSEGRLLAANPMLDGSGDLIIGQSISTRSAARQVGERLWSDVKGAVGQTSEALEGVASGLNATAQDILDKNPDLRSRVESLGSSLGVTGNGASGAPTVEVTPQPQQAAVDVMVTGLPTQSTVRINVGPAGAASQEVAEARTGADGTLRQSVPLPDWLPDGKRVVLTITDGERSVMARSAPFDAE